VSEVRQKLPGADRAKIIAHAGRGLVAVAAGRPICETRENNILGAEALPASACKSGKVY
jgi:hypothetical protein